MNSGLLSFKGRYPRNPVGIESAEHCHGVKIVSYHPGFSFRQLEVLQGTLKLQRKLRGPVSSEAGKICLSLEASWRLEGMKSPVLGPGFVDNQHSDCAGL